MPNRPTDSEQWFDHYLNDLGYDFTPEPDLGITTRPDRLIERDGIAGICEVKEFNDRRDEPTLARWRLTVRRVQFGAMSART